MDRALDLHRNRMSQASDFPAGKAVSPSQTVHGVCAGLEEFMVTRSGKMLAIAALALGVGTMAADAGCEGRKTTGTVVGAVAGGVLGNVLTHGSTGGTVAGAVVGGVAGHEINSDGCNSRYYGRHHHRHYYRYGYRGYYDRDHRWHRD